MTLLEELNNLKNQILYSHKSSQLNMGLNLQNVGFVAALNRDEECNFEDVFASSVGWTTVGTAFGISGGQMVGTSVPTNAEHRMWKALGLTLSDTAWTFDYEANISAATAESLISVIVSDGTTFQPGTLDTLGINWNRENPGNVLRVMGAAHNAGSFSPSSVINYSLNTLYYPRLQRTSATNLRTNIYTDSVRTTHLTGSPKNQTIGSTIINLANIQFSSYNLGTTGSESGTFDNICIKDGVVL